jgi:exodeoxyribonuclease VII large subunit
MLHEIELIDDWIFRMREIIANRIEKEQISLERLLEKSALDSPKEFIQSHRDVVIDLKQSLRNIISTKIYSEQTWFKPRLAQLRTLSPLSTLARGFAIVQKHDGKLVRKASEVKTGELLQIRLEKDSLQAEVKK